MRGEVQLILKPQCPRNPPTREKEDGRDTHPRGSFAEKHSHCRIPVRDARKEQAPVRVAFERGVSGLEQEKKSRNRDLDPQLVWRGKDEQDWSDLVTHAPPIYIQEKVHPKVLIDDLLRRSAAGTEVGGPVSTSSPTSTACPKATRRPSSTSTTPTGPTA